MHICLRVIALLALSLPLNATYAQEKKPILKKRPAVVMIGDRWKMSPTKLKSVNVNIYWESGLENKEIRAPQVDESRSTYLNSAFPLSANKQTYFNVYAFVTVSIDGKITECRFNPETPVEADTSIDPLAIDHVCPMLTQKIQFYPALDNRGEPVEIKGQIAVTYSMQISNPLAPPRVISMSRRQPTKAGPPVPLLDGGGDITFETIGLSEQKMKELGRSKLMAILDVDIEGKAKSCYISWATYVDELDKQICSKAIALNYTPATDENGKTIEGQYLLMLFTYEHFIE